MFLEEEEKERKRGETSDEFDVFDVLKTRPSRRWTRSPLVIAPVAFVPGRKCP